MKEQLSSPVVLFDGICNLCNSSVQFIIRHDKKQIFRFASLQSEFGKKAIQEFQINDNSVVLIENSKAITKSTAALHILKKIGGVYSLLYFFIIVPKSLRDRVYDFIARNRYGWFGKQDACMIPSPELKKLFIE